MSSTEITIPKTNGTPEVVAKAKSDNFDIIVLKFADSRIPEFKEVNNKDWILYGLRNDYPEYLIYQYNKCGKHRAIVNGKSKYILGGGLEGSGGWAPVTNEDGTITPGTSVNRDGETIYDILKKSIKDVEIHGGFRWFITWNALGQVAEIVHEDFYKFRTGKKEGFYWKENWFNTNGQPNNRADPVFYKEFNGQPPVADDPNKIQIFAYNEYGPGTDRYPLPEYIGCANWIDIDIEISKFHLSNLRNGMMPSKMIQFFTGEPTEEKKKEIEKRLDKKFAGAENAGKFVLVFNAAGGKQVEISDLSFSELDKQFKGLGDSTQQEIFTGHQVTSPMLFGIKTEGQLGGNNELRIAYEIFINTYAKPKQQDLEKVVNHFGGLMNKGSSYHFIQLDPIGLVFDVKDIIEKIPIEFILERLGVPKKYIVPSVAAPIVPGTVTPGSGEQSAGPAPIVANDNIKNLTAKQHQQLVRIIRQYSKGQLTEEAAKVLLRTGLGLTEDDINSLLGIGVSDETVAMQKFTEESVPDEDTVIQMFNACGDLREDFVIIKSRKVRFAAEDEANFYRLAFKAPAAVTITEANILDLIAKDKRITPEVIAKTLGTTPEYITAKIAKLIDKGWLDSKQEKIGDDIQIERTLVRPISELPPTAEPETTEILIKYSYEGPQDDRNRPFCAKLLQLNRLYTRLEIESISQRLGYSVWDRRGGWWTKPNGEHSPTCRHIWKSNVVVRKKKGGVV